MNDTYHYNTIERKSTASYSDRGSKFTALVFPVTTIDEFKEILSQIKKEHPKASHFCFAYRMGADGQTFRVSDAGEPSGSAGRPIMGQIDSRGLTNVCIIVIRYFGGTLLGIPGLINAYKSAASMALQLIPIVRKPVEVLYEIHFDYTISNEVMKTFREYDCTIHKKEQQLFCVVEIGVPRSVESDCIHALQKIRGCVAQKKASR